MAGTPEELLGEERLPGELANDLHVQTVARIGPGVGVYHVDLVEVLQVSPRLRQDVLELVSVERLVYGAPGHFFAGDVVFDYEAVFRGASGALTCFGDQGAALGDHALPPAHGSLHEPGGRQILVYRAEVRQPETFQRHLANS